MYKLKIDDNHDSHAKANKSVSTSTILKGVSSVRRPSSTSSSRKNSVLSNTRIHPQTVEVHDRNNKKTNVTSQMNVVKNKNHVANVNAVNALKANVDVLCVSCDKNVLIPCHDKCFAKYKLSVNAKVRRALFTTPRTVKSKSVDTTPVVAKTRFAVVTPFTMKEKDSSASQSTLLFEPISTLSNCIQTKVKTSREWQKWFESNQLLVGHLRASLLKQLRGEDLLTGFHDSNLYTISKSDMAASSPICLMSKATSTKSWLWHRRLSHLNFGIINYLTTQDLVDRILKFKYDKDHLCLAYEQGKSKKAILKPKLVSSTHSKLEMIHMDLCGPMRVESINGKRNDHQVYYSDSVEYTSLNSEDSSKDSTEIPSKEDLDNLFGPLYEEYYETRTPEVSTNSAATTLNNEDTPSSSSIIDPSNMHEFYQQHRSTDQWIKNHPLKQGIGDPSKLLMIRSRLQTDVKMCMYALTMSTTEPKNIKESMLDYRWIESMQDELNHFKRLNFWELVRRPVGRNIIEVKWLWKHKIDAKNTIIRNKSHLVAKGYHQEEGIDFEESFALVA
ncbi:integrase, catalytic region, zinc finger, CCHC-type containing protein [Tanacetum coccineum]